MRIVIIGFQSSGKTTIFNALTGSHAETTAFATGKVEMHQAIVQVPDPRLDQLGAAFKPKKFTPATVEYLDLAGLPRMEGGKGEGLGEKQLAEISTADALLAVVRGFDDAGGAAPNVAGDLEAIALELALADLTKVDNRLEKMEKQIARAPTAEKEGLELEFSGLKMLKEALEEGKPARAVGLSPDQLRRLRGFQLLTLKPVMYLVNDGEAQWAKAKEEQIPLGPQKDFPATLGARLCGQTEMEVAQLPAEDRAVFLESYGIAEPAAHRVIRLCYDLLGRISFFTVGPDECRAWTIARNTLAPGAAGAIHSDLERGFIRAEVIGWQELLDAGTYAEAKKRGKLRLEGKQYVAQDGDVMNILFSA